MKIIWFIPLISTNTNDNAHVYIQSRIRILLKLIHENQDVIISRKRKINNFAIVKLLKASTQAHEKQL